jgi:Cytochrome oxidase complex assembly protein 1
MTTYPAPPPAAPVPPGTQPQKSSGCLKYGLIGCGIAVIILVLLAAVLLAVVFGAVKSTSVYKEALGRAQHDPRVIAVLGSPVHSGFIVTGNVSVKNNSGTADFSFPISGPKGKADLHAEATLDENGWHYSLLTVLPNQGPPIDLLKP